MRRITIYLVVVAILALAASAFAFDIGGAVSGGAKGAAKSASKSAIQASMNSEISKKTRNCSFKPNTTETTCNLNDIVSGLTAANKILENSGLANDCNIHVEAHGPNYSLANDRANAVRNKLKNRVSYWDYYVSGKKKAPENELKVWVQLR